MSYTISEVAELFDISAYTIRYYEKEGLLPFVTRNKAGNREFTDSDINIFKTICCLKDTGMQIKEIRTYINLVMEGSKTVTERKALLLTHRQAVVSQIKSLEDNLTQIDEKIEVYQSPNATEIINKQIKWMSLEKNQLGLQSAFDKV
ncbi:DNA-binding transcriptional MerR regulator [Enterococcus sp. PF1-24]|uniref:MerR family transcriptional regulator n=1 Tax=unclassified Enterococcus TaxID=2608891 RepID=UPI00247623D6|nr:MULTISPECIES: MerR family transcriptional regulator [unclassified Enterococcus]MDH6363049.1 DNA-binding transcriptional MerR regulator [Enterococcus sp. PFB1-1]MDH6400143.1 DNA-binding transcriptional MerR regulator [Enterococcus sp. PF1-24]